jgi:hypothetical protein
MSRTAKAKARPVSECPTAARSPRSPEPAASGRISAASEECSVDMPMLLDALQCVRIGNFSVRLPHDQAGLTGKIVDGRQGGIRFGVGPLAHLLKNRFYIGEVTYRGEVYRGEHETVIGLIPSPTGRRQSHQGP